MANEGLSHSQLMEIRYSVNGGSSSTQTTFAKFPELFSQYSATFTNFG
ncbi:MAG: hypothetical protein WA139_06025 [Candidatus Aenigmatarchaeota archaeon]